MKDDKQKYFGIASGKVVDTNDPQQMGRIRVCVPYFGDSLNAKVSNLPWVQYVSQLGGITNSEDGPVAYGSWSIPKVGATVLVTCIDGDSNNRVWLGCIHGQFLNNTLPHGRYIYNEKDEPVGPVTASGKPIEPLHSNMTKAFTSSENNISPRKSFEFQSRGASPGGGGAVPRNIAGTKLSPIVKDPDDKDVEYEMPDGSKRTITAGYQVSQIEPDLEYPDTTQKNYDSQSYSFTTPGFHSVSFDDSEGNSRFHLRTKSGHQLIMDDTNERIYINVAGGNSWLEMDGNGNIDIYSGRRISIASDNDINFTTAKSFRVHAKDVHIYGTDEVRVNSPGELHLKSNGDVFVSTKGVLNLLSEGEMKVSTNAQMSLTASDDIVQNGSNIHLNGPSGNAASDGKPSRWTSRKPGHEPWARVMMSKEAEQDTGESGSKPNTHKPEFDYSDPNVGKKERDDEIKRNPRWVR